MVRMVLRSFLLLSVFWTVPALSDEVGLIEANAQFTYQKLPIHPGLIKTFHNWESDYRPPIVVSLDVGAAFDTNQYGGVVETGERGRVSITLDNGDVFAYRHLGRVSEDIHVLHTIDKPSGGTGLFQTLTFVQFDVDTRFDRDGLEPSGYLVMSVVRVYSLIGAKVPNVEINDHSVVVHGGVKAVRLNFAKPPIGLANPASVNCARLGGQRESRIGNKGEATLCHLPSGAVCEEWALFRGDCS